LLLAQTAASTRLPCFQAHSVGDSKSRPEYCQPPGDIKLLIRFIGVICYTGKKSEGLLVIVNPSHHVLVSAPLARRGGLFGECKATHCEGDILPVALCPHCEDKFPLRHLGREPWWCKSLSRERQSQGPQVESCVTRWVNAFPAAHVWPSRRVHGQRHATVAYHGA